MNCSTIWRSAIFGSVLLMTMSAARAESTPGAGDVPASCETAIKRAEHQYGLPTGMLGAIGRAESGRTDPVTRSTQPWPWAVQASNHGQYFGSKSEAVAWVRETLASGQPSIDIGCLQINLMHHPQAFATLDAAFDPGNNADYAARFLLKLHGETNDWGQAIAFYHSRTPALGDAYQRLVQFKTSSGSASAKPRPSPPLPENQMKASLVSAWQATMPQDLAHATPIGSRGWESLLHRRNGSP